MRIETQFAKLMRARRARLGLSQTEAADMLGVKFSTLGKWENGQVAPSSPHLKAIAKYLQISLEEVVDMVADYERVRTL